MAPGDGNGVVECACGQMHWGLHGAAGLLLTREPQADASTDPESTLVLLQHRADWSHFGGTWGLPGGARDSHESWADAALRETEEEAGFPPDRARVSGYLVADHGPWQYVTVLASLTPGPLPEVQLTPESQEFRWVPWDEVGDYPLHPGLQSAWPLLNLPRIHLVVDVANVMGATPNGWWRDRAGAATAILERLSDLGGSMVDLAGGHAVVTGIDVVLEGRAKTAEEPDLSVVTVVRAAGHGDDAIVDRVRDLASGPASGQADGSVPSANGRGSHQGLTIVAVTSDRELSKRVSDLGADVWGVRKLLDLLSAGALEDPPTARPDSDQSPGS